MKVKSESKVAQSCPTLCNPMDSSLHQAPPSMGLSRQEYWRGLPFPSPGNLPDPGIEAGSPALQADALLSELSIMPSKFILVVQETKFHSFLWLSSIPYK